MHLATQDAHLLNLYFIITLIIFSIFFIMCFRDRVFMCVYATNSVSVFIQWSMCVLKVNFLLIALLICLCVAKFERLLCCKWIFLWRGA